MKRKFLTLITMVLFSGFGCTQAALNPAEIQTDPNSESPAVSIVSTTRFEHPEADFSFEHPRSWKFRSVNIAANIYDNNARSWVFEYDQFKALEVHAPAYESAIDGCLGKEKSARLYEVRVFETNHPRTTVRLEICGGSDEVARFKKMPWNSVITPSEETYAVISWLPGTRATATSSMPYEQWAKNAHIMITDSVQWRFMASSTLTKAQYIDLLYLLAGSIRVK